MIRKHLPLFIGVGIPILVLIGLFIFGFLLPQQLVNPSHDFVYVSDSYYRNNSNFRVEDGTITFICTKRDPRFDDDCEVQQAAAGIYRYDVEKDANIMLTFEEAQQLTLDPSDVSPDGYRFVNTRADRDTFIFPLFFGSSSSRGFAIEKNMWLRKGIQLKGSYYQTHFLGWITK